MRAYERMNGHRLIVLLYTLGFLLSFPTLAAQESDDLRRSNRQEEGKNYYKKWLDEDVVYIISPEERAVFERLTTDEEKEQFIEQFWYRRDPDPLTGVNEFKEEHYRRIAYANDHFGSGLPGWMTDRGRIYILHGPPDERETHPTGGAYNRPIHEGGGTTSTYPFEVWWYRHIPGVGDDVELEFVDATLTGEYRLALRPEEKDALLYIPGAGLTLAEEMGLAEKKDRPYFNPAGAQDYPLQLSRAKDNPFMRYETHVMVQRPPQMKYPDLKEIVKVNVSYNSLPLQVRKDYFRVNRERVLVPITVELENKNLSFKEENGVYSAKVAIYGLITGITNRVVDEFEDEVTTSYPPESLEQGLLGRSVYQKLVLLDGKMRYKLDLVVKDLRSGQVGVLREAVVPLRVPEDRLAASSVVLSDFIRELPEIPQGDEMFVIGDVKVRPSVRKEFPAGGSVGVYLQVYNLAVDGTTQAPSLRVTYRVLDERGEVVGQTVDERGGTIQFFSSDRVVLLGDLPVEGLGPGRYRVEVEVHDRIKNEELTVRDDFTLASLPQMVAGR